MAWADCATRQNKRDRRVNGNVSGIRPITPVAKSQVLNDRHSPPSKSNVAANTNAGFNLYFVQRRKGVHFSATKVADSGRRMVVTLRLPQREIARRARLADAVIVVYSLLLISTLTTTTSQVHFEGGYVAPAI